MTERLSRAMDHAIACATGAGADDTEASYAGSELHFTRFASSRFTQVGETRSDALRIRVLVNGRLGSQVCASLDTDAVRAGAEAAVAAAKLSPRLDVDLSFNSGTADVGDSAPVALPPNVTAAHMPKQLAEAFRAHADGGVLFAGSVKAHRNMVAVRTAGGLARAHDSCFVDAQVIGLADDASGFAGWCGTPDGDIDLHSLARTAADKARRSRSPLDLKPAGYDVILAPEAVSELLEWMAMASFSATKVLDGTSLLCDRRGQRLCDERITISDSPAAGEPTFDAEGSTRRTVTFIDAGTAGEPVSDLVVALRMGDGATSTGHAVGVANNYENDPAVAHLHVAPGDQSEDELIAAVDRGLYITRFHYVNGLLDTRRATMTGMTRDGTFLIENGEVGPGVRNLRFTQPMLEALSRLGGLGSHVKDVPSWWTDAGVVSTPALLLRGFQFTGTSR